MIGGAYYVHAGSVTWEVIVTSVAVAALVAEILHANNIRDIELDRRAGKVTLATIFGRRGASIEYILLVVVGYGAIIALVAGNLSFWPTLLVGATLPEAVALARHAHTATETLMLNHVLRRTAGLHLRFGSLLTLGLLTLAILDRI